MFVDVLFLLLQRVFFLLQNAPIGAAACNRSLVHCTDRFKIRKAYPPSAFTRARAPPPGLPNRGSSEERNAAWPMQRFALARGQQARHNTRPTKKSSATLNCMRTAMAEISLLKVKCDRHRHARDRSASMREGEREIKGCQWRDTRTKHYVLQSDWWEPRKSLNQGQIVHLPWLPSLDSRVFFATTTPTTTDTDTIALLKRVKPHLFLSETSEQTSEWRTCCKCTNFVL